ncbi:hypothetical protein SCLCIDRAFT_34622, partial [Scleroderma citrinum Foug A]
MPRNGASRPSSSQAMLPSSADVKKDMRMKFVDEGGVAKVQEGNNGSFMDSSLSWKDIPWFKSITNMTIVLKGVATPQDALMAYDHGLVGIVLSNHGGRQLNTARSGLENLINIVEALEMCEPWPNPQFAVFVDGGVRRASDILKAIAS